MRTISTSNNFKVKVDKEDFDYLNQFSWFANIEKRSIGKRVADRGYRYKIRRMHRLIMNCPCGLTIDHKNGNTLDNRKINLRICSIRENNLNKPKIQKQTSSKYKGVSWQKKEKKWYSSIKSNYKSYNLGLYEKEIDAAKAYDNKALELFGKFANINFSKKKEG